MDADTDAWGSPGVGVHVLGLTKRKMWDNRD
jgi:hypothetical protein